MAETAYSSPHGDAAGTTVSFAGTTLRRVFQLNVQGPSGPSKGRATEWTDQAGSCTLSFYGSQAFSLWQDKGKLVINGGGFSVNEDAYCDGITTEFELNGLVRTNLSFQFIK